MKFSFIQLIRFRVDNAKAFQRASMNLNMTIGQAACLPLLNRTIITCESSEKTCGSLCLKFTWSVV